jgi:urea transport system permease protein
MVMSLRLLAAVLFLLGCMLLPGAATAQDEQHLKAAVDALGKGGFKTISAAVTALAALGDPRAAAALQALADGTLYTHKKDGAVVIGERSGNGYRLLDPVTGEAVGEAARGAVDKIKVNNRLRRELSVALGMLTLFSPDDRVRREAAQALFQNGDPAGLASLAKAIEREEDSGIQRLMREALAAMTLKGEAAEADKLAAIEVLAERGDRDALSLLKAAASAADDGLATAAAAGIKQIERRLVLWGMVQTVWYGLSLGSVLLLAAIGLAITFGVMGVINMAHGEMVMLGAYSTYLVQQAFRSLFPEALDYSLLAAVPAAFLLAGAFGVALERSVIRFLYGRPLETLLATWGISLVLQQLVRSLFGPTNREVVTPSWMSGSLELTSGLALTNNRLAIIIFAALVFLLLTLVIKKTTFGLQMRAVTQNRAMANSVGIRSTWVDAMTFGLGSGIAGMAGVALSQIDNVSPNLGQAYIIDSFLVVVFGGVGNIWGTLVGALSLGIANKFLEPFAGAVLGKILILVAVILFIQKRPRGLFALKGRAVDG